MLFVTHFTFFFMRNNMALIYLKFMAVHMVHGFYDTCLWLNLLESFSSIDKGGSLSNWMFVWSNSWKKGERKREKERDWAMEKYTVQVESGRAGSKNGELSVGPVYRNALAKDGFPPLDPAVTTSWEIFRYLAHLVAWLLEIFILKILVCMILSRGFMICLK